MRFGIAVYDLPAPDLLQLAEVAEECGYDMLWLGEHLVVPATVTSTHPTSSADVVSPLERDILASDTVLHDPWTALGALAAATTRLRLATGILVLPLWPPLLVARAAATLHAFSAGRFVLGVGSGWVREEFDALGVPFETRGQTMDTSLEVIRAALAGGPSGNPAVQVCEQAVTISLVLGGGSPPALRRAARVADGWLSSGASSIDEVVRGRDVIETARAAQGRTQLPFTAFGRLPAPEPALVDRYRAEGFEDVVVWGDHLWPRAPHLSNEQKMQHFREHSTQLGVTPVGVAA